MQAYIPTKSGVRMNLHTRLFLDRVSSGPHSPRDSMFQCRKWLGIMKFWVKTQIPLFMNNVTFGKIM